MIHDVLRLIVNQLNRKLGSAGDGESVVLGNIATMDSPGEEAAAARPISPVSS
jgi:hypothetical protein